MTENRKPVWEVTLPQAAPLVVTASTKSEARALAKQILKLRRRLPVGTMTRKVVFNG